MKKSFLVALLTLTTALPAAASLPSASEIEAKLEGMFNFTAIARNQKKVPADGGMTSNQKKSAIDTSAFFAVTAFTKTDSGAEYGAKIAMQPTAQGAESASYGGSHIFLINNYGKLELGSGFDAASQMMVTGLDVARGTGDGWGDYAYFDHNKMAVMPTPFGFFLGSSAFKKNNTETSRKVTYFTPQLGGFRIGVSYIPDTGNLGSTSMTNTDRITDKQRVVDGADGYRYTEKKVSRNAVSLGASFDHNISDGVDVKIAATGEYGKAAKPGTKEQIDSTDSKKVVTGTATNYKLANMRTYNIGAVLTYGNFSYAASYGDVKGFTSREVDGAKRGTRFYSTAVAYTQGPVGVSLSYLLTDTRKNKVDAITVGTDYKLAPGLVPYAELTYFKGRMNKYPVLNDPTKYTTKGTIALIGMKLKF